MEIIQTNIEGLIVLKPRIFKDSRGYFTEIYNRLKLEEKNITYDFLQDNQSRSTFGVIRGLHLQMAPYGQTKLVRVLEGNIFDVAVDLRRGSSTFGKWVGVTLSAENKRQFWLPEGFAHGFVTLSDTSEFLYKTTDYYSPDSERCICWNDCSIGIDWPVQREPVLSGKDMTGVALSNADIFED